MSSPPDPPPRLPSGRHKLPAQVVTDYQRQRLLEAAIEVAGTRGYEAMTVAPVLEAAGVSRATFYELFDDKRSCFLAAFEMAVDSVIGELTAACERGPWPERVRAAIEGLLTRFGEDPALARVVLIEIGVVGPGGRRRYRSALQRLMPLFDPGIEASPLGSELSDRASEMAIGAGASAISREIAEGREGNLAAILPDVLYATLFPILGPEVAGEEMARAKRR